MASRPNIFNVINDLKPLLDFFNKYAGPEIIHLHPLDRFSLFDL